MPDTANHRYRLNRLCCPHCCIPRRPDRTAQFPDTFLRCSSFHRCCRRNRRQVRCRFPPGFHQRFRRYRWNSEQPPGLCIRNNQRRRLRRRRMAAVRRSAVMKCSFHRLCRRSRCPHNRTFPGCRRIRCRKRRSNIRPVAGSECCIRLRHRNRPRHRSRRSRYHNPHQRGSRSCRQCRCIIPDSTPLPRNRFRKRKDHCRN